MPWLEAGLQSNTKLSPNSWSSPPSCPLGGEGALLLEVDDAKTQWISHLVWSWNNETNFILFQCTLLIFAFFIPAFWLAFALCCHKPWYFDGDSETGKQVSFTLKAKLPFRQILQWINGVAARDAPPLKPVRWERAQSVFQATHCRGFCC